MTTRSVPLSQPSLDGREREYLLDCIDSGWISSAGKYVDRFEQAFAEATGTRHAISCANGTVSLHLALVAMGLQPGDEVLMPTLTFVAPANAIRYCGGRPVFVDIEPATWAIDPARIEERITSRTKGIIPVHLRGHPADMRAINAIADRHGLFVIEDAAQAHGATVDGKAVGGLGTMGSFSFFGNKMLTTGEGGMLTTDDDDAAAMVRLLKNQGMTREHRYWHAVIGFNYRLTNLQAAIGLAQVERMDDLLARHRQVARWYQDRLAGVPGLSWQVEQPWACHAWWQFVVSLDEAFGATRDEVIPQLQRAGIDARRIYYPMHELPIFAAEAASGSFPVADRLSSRALCLPTWSGLSRDDVDYVCDQLLKSRSAG